MRLIIDIGNTKIKFFVFNEMKQLDATATPLKLWEETLVTFQEQYSTLTHCIISDVNGNVLEELLLALKELPTLICSTKLKLPFRTKYHPKEQLGADRIALLAACSIEYPKQNILVIDLGSCITFDVLDKGGVHHGGAISPGITMRYKAMNNYSGNLPLLKPIPTKNLFGTATKEAIHSGVLKGVQAEIEGLIDQYHTKFENLTIILTGGDAERLSKPLKNSIFAHSNFLAKGLNFILSMNISS